MSFVTRSSAARAASRLAAAVSVAAALTLDAGAAAAQPACDAGVACTDRDGDGFMPCACAPPGVACDCNDDDATVFPGAPERCDGPADKSCNGVVDPCGPKTGCVAGACVPECLPLDDFGCITGSRLTTIGGRCLCVPDDCSVFGCPPGETCDDEKRCVPNCHAGVRCPPGEICRGKGCVDPCAGVACPSGACIGGVCLPVECRDATCDGVRCAAGSHCEKGACVTDCTGVVCPPERICRSVDAGNGATRGACLDLCSPDPCPIDKACDWRSGTCTPKATREGGLLGEDEARELLLVAGAGWSCDVGRAAGLSAGSLVLGAIAIVALRARRRARRQ
ncbi:MAG: putative metal-binding motif-containing protein [Deltaproteobacteria bacterium]|nr:putative metal-binding motif-containing protein [Deltaproteobacteria bacterium]